MKKLFVGAVVVSTIAVSGIANAGDVLTKEALSTLYSGNSYEMKFTIQAGPRTIDITTQGYADPSGKVYGKNNRGDQSTGDWKVDDQGRLCVNWQNAMWNDGCHAFEKVGDGQYRVSRSNGSYAKFVSFPGDTHGLKPKN